MRVAAGQGRRIRGAEAMQRKKPCAGSTTVAFALGLFLLCFTLLTVYLFAIKYWWFPEPITTFGREIDRQFMRTFLITGVVFVLSQLALGWAVFRYRDTGGRANYSHGNNTMEFLWTLATLVLFVGLAAQYVKDSDQNFFGLDPNDQAGKDDLVSPVIAVPVNREVELILRSKDVTHSFFVRELRLKQDAVPG